MRPEQRLLGKLALAYTVLSVVAFAPLDVGARPGGGSTYKAPSSSGSRSSSGSSSRSSSGTSSGSYSRSSGSTSTGSSSRSSGSSSTGSSSSSTGSSSSGSGVYVPGSGSYSPSSSSDDPGRPMSLGCIKLIALIVVVGVLLVVFLRWREGANQREWETTAVRAERAQAKQDAHERAYGSLLEALAELRALDPAFSFVLFEDFLYALYAQAHTARGEGRLEKLAPYLSRGALERLGSLGSAHVSTVIVGAMHIEQVVIHDWSPTRVVAVFEANYAEATPSGEQAYYTTERWVLERPRSARSRPPERSRIIDCPSCGAPLDQLVGRACAYCKQTITEGGYDWMVGSIEILERAPRPPMLTSTVEEVGTDAPTVIAPDVRERFEDLCRKDPQVTWESLQARVGLIFERFHQGWRAREPKVVRPFLSDNLFQTQVYWIDAYKSQHLRNRTDGARIVGIHLARVISDAYYDAVTVRVFATGLDFTVDDSDRVVSGDPNRERNYTEYWTLIRGVDRTGAPRSTPECPSCGASLDDITMAGTCAHCNAKVTAGQFDWVLSRIEQDESYG